MERIFHTWDKWECYPAGFYENRPPREGMTEAECREAYRVLLSDIPRFEEVLERVITEWVNSCEHYLTNERMNRIAWLGQAALCIDEGIPSKYRGGYMLLTDQQKQDADQAALRAMNRWMARNGYPELTADEAGSKTEMDLY